MKIVHGSEYSRQIQHIYTWIIQVFRKFLIVGFLALFFLNEAAANEKLSIGKWQGTYLTHEGTRYKIIFIVSYDDALEKSPAKIKMINLDLEPVSEFTYQLSDIEIGENQLQFKIPKEFETETCALEKKDDSYAGACISSAGNADKGSEITMLPPENKPLESE